MLAAGGAVARAGIAAAVAWLAAPRVSQARSVGDALLRIGKGPRVVEVEGLASSQHDEQQHAQAVNVAGGLHSECQGERASGPKASRRGNGSRGVWPGRATAMGSEAACGSTSSLPACLHPHGRKLLLTESQRAAGRWPPLARLTPDCLIISCKLLAPATPATRPPVLRPPRGRPPARRLSPNPRPQARPGHAPCVARR